MKGWPAVGPVLDVPPVLATAFALAILTGIAWVWLEAPTIGRWIGRRTRTVRALSALAVVVLGLGSVFIWTAPSVSYGSTAGGGDPRLVAMAVEATSDSRTYVYGYAPHTDIRATISIRNAGPVPITILGISSFSNPYVQNMTVRLAPGGPTFDGLPVRPDATGQRWFSEPFAPFELAPGEETNAALALLFADCPGMRPVPTRSPDSPVPFDRAPSGPWLPIVPSLTVRYSALGIDRVTTVDMSVGIGMATGDNTFFCGR